MSSEPRFCATRLNRFAARLQADVDAGAIAGASALVGGRNGEIWRADVGFRDVDTGDPLRADAVWRIFSMTKVIVSVAAMVFAERGTIRLDQPVAEFIPAFSRLRVLAPGGGTVPAAAPPTVQDLLRHTAGLS